MSKRIMPEPGWKWCPYVKRMLKWLQWIVQEDAEMVAMDSSSNKTFIDEASKGYPIWIRGTNLRWIWDRGYKTYSYFGVKILSVT